MQVEWFFYVMNKRGEREREFVPISSLATLFPRLTPTIVVLPWTVLKSNMDIIGDCVFSWKSTNITTRTKEEKGDFFLRVSTKNKLHWILW